ncbi:GlxA family transcriptional regulator [uncultured Roseibium sp.]|uniref:GlxA family transcriptional regulator n=1 Tax=uncultured Roseibium sp. TaxID=1936171 RepID=UPI0026142CBB|nr:GlxA family transcriptional regulator [uncultured Roseibium sp.]
MKSETRRRKIGFLLIDGYALMSVASAIEPLRAANLLGESKHFTLSYYSQNAGKVRASCGAYFETEPLGILSNQVDLLFVVAGSNLGDAENAAFYAQLRRLAAHGVELGGISGGGSLLAKAGLMDDRRLTVHWEHFEELNALSDAYFLERRIFVIDRNRYTCAGGVASLDMMLALVKSELGAELATTVSDWLVHSGMRSADEPLRSRYLGSNTSLNSCVTAAVELMESHVTDLLTLDQIAMLAGVSSRKLQRNFKSDLGISVMRCYMDIRLHKADELLRKTRMAVAQVAFSTGFVDQAHFASVYREKFGFSPTERRKKTRVAPSAVRAHTPSDVMEPNGVLEHH